jgi:dTDP-4-dehydrorhamnose 3,5-epimerase
MKIEGTTFAGVHIVRPEVFKDDRGQFIKAFQSSFFKRYGLYGDFHESYSTVSHDNVLRGLHFQIPPAHGPKLVYCAEGRAQDVLLDLRRSSATYKKHLVIPMDGATSDVIYIPEGIAHGFCVVDGPARVQYFQHAEYVAELDKGIRWDSAGIQWPCAKPIVSKRDSEFPGLDEFDSPFP